MNHVDQGSLALPAPPREKPDYEGLSRAELTEALAAAKAATIRPPWDYRKQRYWRVVGPQMSGWLPPQEQTAFLSEFNPELDRIESMFTDEEKETPAWAR